MSTATSGAAAGAAACGAGAGAAAVGAGRATGAGAATTTSGAAAGAGAGAAAGARSRSRRSSVRTRAASVLASRYVCKDAASHRSRNSMSRAARGKFRAFRTTQTPPRASVRSRDSIKDTISLRAGRCFPRAYQFGGRRGSLSSICTTAPVRTASSSDAFALLRGVSTWVNTTSSSLLSSLVTGRSCAARASVVARTLTKSMPTNCAAAFTRSTMGLLASMPSSPHTSSTSTDVEAIVDGVRSTARVDGLRLRPKQRTNWSLLTGLVYRHTSLKAGKRIKAA